jgi:hypothetical protein
VAKGFFFFFFLPRKGEEEYGRVVREIVWQDLPLRGPKNWDYNKSITTEGEIQEVLAQGALEVFDR